MLKGILLVLPFYIVRCIVPAGSGGGGVWMGRDRLDGIRYESSLIPDSSQFALDSGFKLDFGCVPFDSESFIQLCRL